MPKKRLAMPHLTCSRYSLHFFFHSLVSLSKVKNAYDEAVLQLDEVR